VTGTYTAIFLVIYRVTGQAQGLIYMVAVRLQQSLLFSGVAATLTFLKTVLYALLLTYLVSHFIESSSTIYIRYLIVFLSS